VVFTTLEEHFELIVIFFGLTNSLATFQIMMNEILWNLINIGEVASFINDIIVGMEEEEHDKIAEEVIKILVENNLYVKLEKCKWKIKKIRFLGVVIGADRIKMEEEKVREVLDWLTPQRVKDT